MPICQDEETEAGEVVAKVTEQTRSGAGSHSELLNKWGCHHPGPTTGFKALSLDCPYPLQVPHIPPTPLSRHSGSSKTRHLSPAGKVCTHW